MFWDRHCFKRVFQSRGNRFLPAGIVSHLPSRDTQKFSPSRETEAALIQDFANVGHKTSLPRANHGDVVTVQDVGDQTAFVTTADSNSVIMTIRQNVIPGIGWLDFDLYGILATAGGIFADRLGKGSVVKLGFELIHLSISCNCLTVMDSIGG